MKVTFILRNVTDTFFDGNGESITGLLNMSDAEKFDYLNRSRHTFGFGMKIGTGQFRDSVELNGMLRKPHTLTFKLEPRRGYRLATFEVVNVAAR